MILPDGLYDLLLSVQDSRQLAATLDDIEGDDSNKLKRRLGLVTRCWSDGSALRVPDDDWAVDLTTEPVHRSSAKMTVAIATRWRTAYVFTQNLATVPVTKWIQAKRQNPSRNSLPTWEREMLYYLNSSDFVWDVEKTFSYIRIGCRTTQ